MPKLHMLKSVTDTINTSLIFESESSLIVFDGGFASEAEYLHEYLRGLGGHVDTWFLTHAHKDHVDACHAILTNYGDITVDKVCYNFPQDKWFATHDSTGEGLEVSSRLRKVCADKKIPTETVELCDLYDFDGFSVRVLQTPDESITNNPINNSSVVYRVEIGETRVLILGDLGVEGGRQLVDTLSPSMMRADYCQMAHHGQNGVEKEVYEAIRPRFCLWCTPSWVWDNLGPCGYDTGRLQTVIVRGWMSELGCVERHYRMIDGTAVIDL